MTTNTPQEKDPCAGFHRGADTSMEAHASTPPPKRQLIREHILTVFQRSFPIAYTCEDIERMTNYSHQTVSARITELRKTGLIHDTGYRAKTKSGRNARVYQAGPAPDDTRQHQQQLL